MCHQDTDKQTQFTQSTLALRLWPQGLGCCRENVTRGLENFAKMLHVESCSLWMLQFGGSHPSPPTLTCGAEIEEILLDVLTSCVEIEKKFALKGTDFSYMEM